MASRAKITEDLYDACYRFLSHVRGSLLIVSVMASAGFAAISGSTIVNAAVFTVSVVVVTVPFYFPSLSGLVTTRSGLALF